MDVRRLVALVLLGFAPAGAFATAPTLTYLPTNSVFLNGPTGAPRTGQILVLPSGGSGTGAANTTLLFGCQVTGTDFDVSVPADPMVFVAGSPSQTIDLTCLVSASSRNGDLNCQEQRGLASPVNRHWNLTCPPGTTGFPPNLVYDPAQGTPIPLVGSAQTPLRAEKITVTPSGGSSADFPQSSRVTSCTFSPNASAFQVSGVPLALNPNDPPAAITVSCNAGAQAISSTMTCVETRDGQPGQFNRSWPVTCPATTCAPIPDGAYVAPSSGTSGMVCASIGGMNRSIASVVASLSIAHPRAGELTVKLVPDPNVGGPRPTITLMDRPNGTQAGLTESSWISLGGLYPDSAETLGAGLDASGVACRDDGRCRFAADAGAESSPPLGALAGTSAAGAWQLCVGDSVPGNAGSVCGVDLDFPPVPIAAEALPHYEFEAQLPAEQAPFYSFLGVVPSSVRLSASDRLLGCGGDYLQSMTSAGAVIRTLSRPPDLQPPNMRCYALEEDGTVYRRASSNAANWIDRVASNGATLTQIGTRISASQCASANLGELARVDAAMPSPSGQVLVADGVCGQVIDFDAVTGAAQSIAATFPPSASVWLASDDQGALVVAEIGTAPQQIVIRRFDLTGNEVNSTTLNYTDSVVNFFRGNTGNYYVSLVSGDAQHLGPTTPTFDVLDAQFASIGGTHLIPQFEDRNFDYSQQLVGAASNGELFVADRYDQAVRKLDPSGNRMSSFSMFSMDEPTYVYGSIAIAPDGTVFQLNSLFAGGYRFNAQSPSGAPLGERRETGVYDHYSGLAAASSTQFWTLRLNNAGSSFDFTARRLAIAPGNDFDVPLPAATYGRAIRLDYRIADDSLFVLSVIPTVGSLVRVKLTRLVAGQIVDSIVFPYDYESRPPLDSPNDANKANLTVDPAGDVYVLLPGDVPRLVQVSARARTLLSERPVTPAPTGFPSNGGIAVNPAGYFAYAEYDSETSSMLRVTSLGSSAIQRIPEGYLPGQVAHTSYYEFKFAPDGRLYVPEGEAGRVSIFAPRPAALAARAIIVAGGGPYIGNNLWDATEASAGQAYRALAYQGFTKETMRVLSPNPSNDLDGNGAFDDISGNASIANLSAAITGAFAADAQDLLVYLVDHGGPSTFRLNDTELLDATALDAWLDQWQSAHPNGRVVVVVDSCNSGSFVPLLAGPNRAIIASADPTQDARFLYNGALSFSSLLFAQIQSGADLRTAFAGAEQVINETFPPGTLTAQTPWLDADGDGVANEQSDRTAAAAYVIGNGIGVAAARPTIADTSAPAAISGSSSATLGASGVAGASSIARVWVVMQPPALQLSQSATPLANLPTVDLAESTPGEYAATYDDFKAEGTWVLTFFARDVDGRVSRPAQRTVTVQSPLSKKAVVAVLGTPTDPDLQAYLGAGDYAVDALRQQGYGPDGNICTSSACDEIYYLRPGSGGDATPTLANLQAAITAFAAQGSANAIVFITGERASGGLRVNATETLTPAQLDAWLDTLQQTLPGAVTVIVDADDAKPFLTASLPAAGKQRVTIVTTNAGQIATHSPDGTENYARVFFNLLANGSNYYAAHQRATGVIAFNNGVPKALLDDNGNGNGTDLADGRLALRLTAGLGIVLAGDPPFTASVQAPASLSGQPVATVVAQGVQGTAGVAGASVTVRSPAGLVRHYAMSQMSPTSWQAAVDCLATESGDYELAVRARDVNGALSAPRYAVVTQSATGNGACATAMLGVLFANGFE